MRALSRILMMPALSAVLMVVTPAFRATQSIPAQLSDEAFWRLVTDSSEPDGTFLSENFVSNELGYQYVIPSVVERVQPGGAYIGVGPEQNFTYMAAVRPGIAFIVDIRRQNMIEHLLYKALFELSQDRAEFLSRLFARKPNANLNRSPTAEELFAAFSALPEDPEFYRENLEVVKGLLLKEHRYALSQQDVASLEHVYGEFARQGPDIRYAVSNVAFSNGTFVSLERFRRDAVRVPITQLPAGPPAPAGTSPEPTEVSAATQNPIPVNVNLLFGMQFPTYANVMMASDAVGKNWGYLATEEGYQAVRLMQQKNLIVPVVGDFAGIKALRAVGQYLKERDAVVSVFYVSNVEQYLTPLTKLHAFYTNVAELPLDASSTFIRSAQAPGVQPGVAQSSISSVQTVMDAVLEGRARSSIDILQMSH